VTQAPAAKRSAEDTPHREAPLPGTRPEGARDEVEAAARVREMFGNIAPRYDFLNHLLSFSLDRVWRRRTAERFAEILRNPRARVLDLCCGTGDLAFALERRGRAGDGAARIFGCDFAEAMLVRARQKSEKRRASATFLSADALLLPFADATFDLVTAAFGFRNLANYAAGLREIARVLRPGGEVGILEFSEGEHGVMAVAARFYCRRIVPGIGRLISGHPRAYSYLPASVEAFPRTAELASWMEEAGFGNVQFEAWNFGSVALHRGRKAG